MRALSALTSRITRYFWICVRGLTLLDLTRGSELPWSWVWFDLIKAAEGVPKVNLR